MIERGQLLTFQPTRQMLTLNSYWPDLPPACCV